MIEARKQLIKRNWLSMLRKVRIFMYFVYELSTADYGHIKGSNLRVQRLYFRAPTRTIVIRTRIPSRSKVPNQVTATLSLMSPAKIPSLATQILLLKMMVVPQWSFPRSLGSSVPSRHAANQLRRPQKTGRGPSDLVQKGLPIFSPHRHATAGRKTCMDAGSA